MHNNNKSKVIDSDGQARCESCEELASYFDLVRCKCGTYRCGKCSIKKCSCIECSEAENPQPEYCDCDGYHDGSCHQRQIEELRKDRDILAAEVRAWRDWFERDGKIRSGKAKLKPVMTSTNESGALSRA